MTATYRDFVQPAHPLVADFFGAAGDQTDALDAALAVLRRRASYVAAAGHRTFDELRTLYHETPDGRVPLNCLALSSLLVSRLRAAGVPSDEVFVVIGMRRDYPPNAGRLDLHAWTVLRTGTVLRWIDPATLAIEQAPGGAWLDRHHVHLLCNDERVVSFLSERAVRSGRSAIGFASTPSAWSVPRRVRRCSIRACKTACCPSSPAVRRSRATTRRRGWRRPPVRSPVSARRGHRAHDLCSSAGGSRATCGRGWTSRWSATWRSPTETVAQLKVAYQSCTAARRFLWREVEHSITAGLFLDLGGWPAARPRGPTASRTERACGVGVRAHRERQRLRCDSGGARGSAGRVVELWHRSVRRTPLRLSERGVASPCEAAELVAGGGAHAGVAAGDTRRLIELLDAGAECAS